MHLYLFKEEKKLLRSGWNQISFGTINCLQLDFTNNILGKLVCCLKNSVFYKWNISFGELEHRVHLQKNLLPACDVIAALWCKVKLKLQSEGVPDAEAKTAWSYYFFTHCYCLSEGFNTQYHWMRNATFLIQTNVLRSEQLSYSRE